MFKSKIARDTALLTLMQLALDSSALLLNTFITRKLGASAIGIFSLLGSFLGLAGILSNGNAFLCTSRLVSEELGKKQGDPCRVLLHGIKLCLMLSVTVSAAVIMLADPLSRRFFSGADIAPALRLMPAALICGAVSCCFKGYFNASRKASAAAAGDILEFIVKAAVIVFLTLNSHSSAETAVCRIMISSIIAGNAVSLVFMLILFAKLRTKGTGCCSLSFRDYASAAFPIMGGGILTAVLSSTNDALIPFCLRQYGDSQEQALSLFGIFEAIVIPTLFFPSVVLCSMSGMIVSETARASAAGSKNRIRSMTSRLIKYTIIYAVFASSVLMKTGVHIGALLGGSPLAGQLISCIAPVVPFIYLEIVLEALIKGMGMQSFSSLNYLAEYTIRIAAVLILVPRLGFAGIAVSYYASNIFGNISRLVKVLRRTGVRFEPLSMFVSPVVYSFMTMLTAELIMRAVTLSDASAAHTVIFTLIWLGLYSAVFGLMVIFETKESNNVPPFVHDKQMLTQKVL